MTIAVGYLDARTEAYVDEVLRAIDARVPIVEAYLIGSAAVGGFDPETSDVDVVVVVERALGDERARVIDAVRSPACPVRDLELVVYVAGKRPPSFELNVNHGDETEVEPFWFVLDAARAQTDAVPLLHGRPWTAVFDPIPDERIRDAMLASLAWAEPLQNDFARNHAVRARHYLERGEWITKAEAAE